MSRFCIAHFLGDTCSVGDPHSFGDPYSLGDTRSVGDPHSFGDTYSLGGSHLGEVFPAGGLPLHVTLAGNFGIGVSAAELAASLRDVLDGLEPVVVTAGDEELFGPQRNVRVRELEPAPLMVVHRAILASLVDLGAVFDEPAHCGDGYRPHVTATALAELGGGERFTVDRLEIVDLKPGGDGRLRAVVDSLSIGVART